MKKRSKPVFFWNYDASKETAVKRVPYIDPVLQEGTTPLVKMLDGKYTRSFLNLRHPVIRESDFDGPKSVLDNRYKLVVDGDGNGLVELYDIQKDPNETTDLSEEKPDITNRLMQQLVNWQQSVLNSLTGKDY